MINEFLNNPVFSGVATASVVTYVLYLLRETPGEIWRFIIWRCTCSLTIFNEDESFEKVGEWLASLEYAKRARRLRLTSHWNEEQQNTVEVLAPGLGNHLFWYKRRPVIVSRTLPDKGGIGGWKRFEDIEITTIGWNPKILHELVAEVQETRKRQHSSTVNVFLYRNRWRLAHRKLKRPMSSVIIPDDVRDELVKDVQRFLDSRKWYQEHGVPYRRGYRFDGPPGCGKTSLVLAIASQFDRPIYALNLGSINNDDELIDAVCEVPEHGILLMEDIDAAKASAKRATAAPASNDPDAPIQQEPERREISLSALLNVIDGVFAREGRILCMTTNHPEKVDPALKRPGRTDYELSLGPLEYSEALAMCRRFIPGKASAAAFTKSVQLPIPAAELQEKLVRHVRRAE